MSRRLLAGVIRRMPNIRRKARKTVFPPYLELDEEDAHQTLDFVARNLDDSVIQLEAA